jgi:hypothetical protein
LFQTPTTRSLWIATALSVIQVNEMSHEATTAKANMGILRKKMEISW